MRYWVLGINPEPWKSPTGFRRGRGVGMAPNPKQKAYQEAIADEFSHQNPDAVRHGGELSVTFYFWRSTAHGQPCDATNLQKATEDALQDVIYGNDRENRDVRGIIVEQSIEARPAVLIEIKRYKPPRGLVVPDEITVNKWSGSTWEPPPEESF